MKKPKANKRKYLYRQPQDNGKVYVYFRDPRTRKLTRLPDDEASAEFATPYHVLLRAVEQANDPHPAKTADQLGRWKNPRDYAIDSKVAFRPASIGWFIDLYRKSNKFAGLSNGTRYNYGLALDFMKKEIGVAMLHDLTPQNVDVYSGRVARERGGSFADVQIGLITNLWEFAKGFSEFKRGTKHCPTIGATRHYEHYGEGILAWPQETIEKFQETAKPHLAQVVNGLHYTGQRGVDVVKMKWSDYDGELINVVQQKTGEKVWLHCPVPLRRMLENMPRIHEYIFTNAWKRPYKHAGTLGTAIRNHLRKIGKRDYSMHGLRKNAGMELAMAGCTVPEIMAVLGHQSPKMAIFYTKQAEKKLLGRTATIKWEAEIEVQKNKRVAERRANIKPV